MKLWLFLISKTLFFHEILLSAMPRIRSFIAIELGSDLREGIAGIQEKLRSSRADVRWVKPESIHLTLKFLGDIEEGDVDSIADCLKRAADGLSPFTVEIREVGAFPNLRNPRVLWVGVSENSSLSMIQSKIEEEIEGLGFPREGRPFRPHLTVGRVKSPKLKDKLTEVLEKVRAQELGALPVEELILFRSELRPAGAVYTKLRTVKLS